MTKDQKFALLSAESPELMHHIQELKERISELQERVNPVLSLLMEYDKLPDVQDDLVGYLEVKYQVLLAYCMNMIFYLAMKCEGESVKSHPVMRQLLELRYVMEKLQPLDGKLKYQVDRLVNLASMNSEERESVALRPNIGAFAGGSDAEDDYDGENEMQEDSDDNLKSHRTKSKDGKTELYRAPKISAAPYKFDESVDEREEKQRQKNKNKLRNSAIFESLREEFGSAPELTSSSGLDNATGDAKALKMAEDERRDFEEERFVRLTLSRKEKKAIKRQRADSQKLDSLTDIGDIGDIDDLEDFVGMRKGRQNSQSEPLFNVEANADALKRAAGVFKKFGDFADQDEKSSKRRRAPDFSMEEIDLDETNEFDGLVEDFSRRKKDFEAKKKSHYSAEPRYGGLDEGDIDEGKKRAASYEIIKNRGLTPHRKKSNRNPRVKKREKYAKALVSRKGQVREVITGQAGSYSGESTGIKSGIARSRKIMN